jgi:hypothetical protein
MATTINPVLARSIISEHSIMIGMTHLITDMTPHSFRIPLVKNANIVAIREHLLDVNS